eukprot:156482-Pyramimonas_sp.AAC.1
MGIESPRPASVWPWSMPVNRARSHRIGTAASAGESNIIESDRRRPCAVRAPSATTGCFFSMAHAQGKRSGSFRDSLKAARCPRH